MSSFLGQMLSQECFSDASILKASLLEHLVAFESIECSYTYCCNMRAEKNIDRLKLRWKNGLLWYSSHIDNPSDNPDANSMIMESIVDGLVSGYWEKANRADRYFHTNYDSLRFMAYNELSPLTVIGVSSLKSYYSFTHNLRDTLKSDNTPYIEKRDQKTLLYLFPEPPDGDFSDLSAREAIIVFFDLDGYVIQVDHVLRPGCSLEEIQLLASTHNPREIYRLSSRDIFEDYRNFNGYSIPTKLKRMSYDIEATDKFRNLAAELNSAQMSQVISPEEFEIKLYRAIPSYSVSEEWHVNIDPSTVIINNPNLDRTDFTIIPPKEPTVTWDIDSGNFIDEFGEGNYEDIKKHDEARRIARIQAKMKKNYALPIAVTVGAFSLALLATAIVLKVRGKR